MTIVVVEMVGTRFTVSSHHRIISDRCSGYSYLIYLVDLTIRSMQDGEPSWCCVVHIRWRKTTTLNPLFVYSYLHLCKFDRRLLHFLFHLWQIPFEIQNDFGKTRRGLSPLLRFANINNTAWEQSNSKFRRKTVFDKIGYHPMNDPLICTHLREHLRHH